MRGLNCVLIGFDCEFNALPRLGYWPECDTAQGAMLQIALQFIASDKGWKKSHP